MNVSVQPLVQALDSIAMNDDYNIVYWICLILGAGVSLAVNLLLTASDYFTSVFPSHSNIMFYIVPAISVPQFAFLILSLFYSHNFSFTFRITFAYAFTAVVIVFIPIFIRYLSEDVSFWLVLSIASCVGIGCAILQSTIVAFCNFLPEKYIIVSFAGQALGGVFACIIRIITKLLADYTTIMSDSESGFLYFVVGAIFDLVCIIGFLYILKSVFVKFYLQHYFWNRRNRSAIENIDEGSESSEISNFIVFLERRNSNETVQRMSKKKSLSLHKIGNVRKSINSTTLNFVFYFNVYKKIWRLSLAVFLVCFVSLLAFPGLVTGIKSQYSAIEANDWFPVILVTQYNIGGYCGRKFLAPWFSYGLNHQTLWIGCCLRILIVPAFVVLYDGSLLQNDFMVYFVNAVFSLTDGQFACLCFMYAPKLVDDEEQEICSAIMNFSLVFGICVGSYVALAMYIIL